jgi:hypothetical protein
MDTDVLQEGCVYRLFPAGTLINNSSSNLAKSSIVAY